MGFCLWGGGVVKDGEPRVAKDQVGVGSHFGLRVVTGVVFDVEIAHVQRKGLKVGKQIRPLERDGLEIGADGETVPVDLEMLSAFGSARVDVIFPYFMSKVSEWDPLALVVGVKVKKQKTRQLHVRTELFVGSLHEFYYTVHIQVCCLHTNNRLCDQLDFRHFGRKEQVVRICGFNGAV